MVMRVITIPVDRDGYGWPDPNISFIDGDAEIAVEASCNRRCLNWHRCNSQSMKAPAAAAHAARSSDEVIAYVDAAGNVDKGDHTAEDVDVDECDDASTDECVGVDSDDVIGSEASNGTDDGDAHRHADKQDEALGGGAPPGDPTALMVMKMA